ncbi:MAG: hypothetical protein L3J44_02455 [Campylobacteraceae bacterium]|nr:hypothetical protein [Campylobacteraceae bacterium]
MASDTFWFSYRSVTLNQTLIYEEKNIAPLTVPYKGDVASICKVKISLKKYGTTMLSKLNTNFFKILPCFYGAGSKITSQSTSTLNSMNDTVELIIIPTRFIVDFKDDFANITILK